ncbi:hypothetical protein CLPU_4c01090 [Gottschalkia purinilytica]|uniref:DUF5301 domain-containing protein n=1 Tax=Gottschalkia purinilytica TaxID=1503 RepID=A0A0L0WC66_GOTPU|nr:DUF5301 domain-containing protein [Gottschalkia purinilytica]KNF09063.1 hypothetical protein CLPU_4c01090 [Gottschalkia purinilytica]
MFFKLYTNNNNVKVPESDRIIEIKLLNTVNYEIVEENIINEFSDIKEYLNMLKSSTKVDEKNISTYSHDYPDREKLVVGHFKLSEDGGYTTHYIYKEGDNFYFEQPYYGVFKLNLNDLYKYDMIIKFLN